MIAPPILVSAREYVRAGLSVIPVRADGSKAPLVPGWREFATRKPTDTELVSWFGNGTVAGIGVPGGPASGNLAVLDFETAEAWERWRTSIGNDAAGFLDECPIVRTPSGGVHAWCRLPDGVPGTVLARHADKTVMIEIRGEGHQVLAPGCPLSCHKTGRPYQFENRGWLDRPADPLSFETWFAWCELAAALTEYVPPAQPAAAPRPARDRTDDSPGDDFNRRGTWDESGLFAAGWMWARRLDDDRGFIRRPGKRDGISGTVGLIASKANGWPLCYVFTSNAAPLEAGRGYDRFGVYTRLLHRGDFHAATKAIASLGYGKPLTVPKPKSVPARVTADTSEKRSAAAALATALPSACVNKGADSAESKDVPLPPSHDAADNPHRLAGGYLGARDRAALRYWRGEFHLHDGGAYEHLPDDDLRASITEFVRGEMVNANAIERTAWADAGAKGKPPKVRPVTSRLISDVLQAIRGIAILPGVVDPPAWIDGASGPDPAGLLPMRNGILDLSAAASGKSACLLRSSPSFFTPTAAPFDFDRAAPAPETWLKFLGELWPDDAESIACLQEWFGLLLVPDTRHQKILFLLGPRRGGKGTIARVLRELVGSANVAGPTLGSLASNFGLAPLLGKSVAVIADARLSGRSDAAIITERLLSISGEDAVTVDRKHRDQITVKLPTRFVILSNELPRLNDGSGALAGRFVLLRLTRSFYGDEDHDLSEKLRPELPGILLWAIAGWKRLRNRGRFVQPASGASLMEDMEDLSSPVGAFVRDRCRVGMGFKVEVGELFTEWKRWCEEHGRREAGTVEVFARDLRGTVPMIERARPRAAGGRIYVYTGIRLRHDFEFENDETPAEYSPELGPGGPRDHLLHA